MNTNELKPGDDCVCVDVETTGTDPEVHGIVAVGVTVVRNKQIERTWEQVVCPQAGTRYDERAMQVHGIEKERIEAAPAFEEVLEELDEIAGDLSPVAHNARFDQEFLGTELKRIGREDHRWCDYAVWMDTYGLSRERYPGNAKHGLDALAKRLKVQARASDEAHEAGRDTRILAEVWLRLGANDELGAQGSLFDAGKIAHTGPVRILAWKRDESRVQARTKWLTTMGITT